MRTTTKLAPAIKPEDNIINANDVTLVPDKPGNDGASKPANHAQSAITDVPNTPPGDGTAPPSNATWLKSLQSAPSKPGPKVKSAKAQPLPASALAASHNSEDSNSVAYWITRLRSEVGMSVTSLVRIGQTFLEAKSKLAHGEWEHLFEGEDQPFSLRSAQRLMQVAGNQALAKATNSSLLPSSTEALVTLAQLDPDVIETGLADGDVRPDMTMSQARQFVRSLDTTAPEDKGFDYETTRASLTKKILTALEKVPDDFLDILVNDIGSDMKAAVKARLERRETKMAEAA